MLALLPYVGPLLEGLLGGLLGSWLYHHVKIVRRD